MRKKLKVPRPFENKSATLELRSSYLSANYRKLEDFLCRHLRRETVGFSGVIFNSPKFYFLLSVLDSPANATAK